MQLRDARLEDAAELARLASELGYPSDADSMATRLDMLLPLSGHRIVVAQGDAGRLRGWIAVERRCLLESGECMEIIGLVVGTAARGDGIDRALVADAESWARMQGFAAIVVRSNVVRERAHAFYTGLGFTRAKSQHVYWKSLT